MRRGEESLVNKLEETLTIIIADILIILIIAFLLQYFSNIKNIDASYSLYNCSPYCYPNYFLGASAITSILVLILLRIFFFNRVISQMLIYMLPIAAVAIYIDLFTRKNVNITIYPFIIVFSKDSHASISIDLGQIMITAFIIYMIYRIFIRKRSSSSENSIYFNA